MTAEYFMVSKYCVYSNTDGHLFYFIFFCVQSPTIISVAIDILVHVLLHKVILVPKHSKRISVLIDVAQFFSKKTRAIHTSTTNTKFSLLPSLSAIRVIILLSFCLSKAQNKISCCYWNLPFSKVLNLRIFSDAVGQLDLLFCKLSIQNICLFFWYTKLLDFLYFIDINPLTAIYEEIFSYVLFVYWTSQHILSCKYFKISYRIKCLLCFLCTFCVSTLGWISPPVIALHIVIPFLKNICIYLLL